MIRHIVLFRRHPGMAADDPAVVAAVAAAAELGRRIPGILAWSFGPNVTEREIAYDYGLVADLPDQQALRAYLEHPAHLRVITELRGVATWVIADLVVDGSG
ncbi:MAG: Dabb family protein [Actinomycetes bacterium]